MTLKWDAYNVMCGFTKKSADSIKDHTQCNIGKFYEIALAENSIRNILDREHPLFKQLYDAHEMTHTSAQKVVEFYNRGDSKGAVAQF
jgi:glutaredoxin-related protein